MTTEVTEVEEQEQRSISELLQLDTYQGMTDAEIQSLIDFYKEDSYNQGYHAGEIAALAQEWDKVVANSEAAAARAEAAFNMAVNSVVKLESVDNG